MTMRVALELQPCFGVRSGIGTYTFEIAKRLCSDGGIEFQGNVFNFAGRNDLSQVLDVLPPHMAATNKLMPYGVFRRIWHTVPISYDSLFPHADITHFFNYIVPPHIKGTVINTVYDMAYKLYPKTLNPRNLARITRDIRYSVERSQCIVTISESAKREILQEFDLDEKAVQIIYPSFSPLTSALPLEQLKTRFGITGAYILFLGNLEPRKNIERLLSAFAHLTREVLPDYQLVVAGQKGWLFDGIFRTVEQLHLEDRVIFTGYISAEEKSTLYRHAALFAFPSLYEGFGIPILEAMSVGAPVLCSNTSSMPEVAGDAAVLVDPLDVEDIADGMYRLLTDDALRAEKIAAGYTQAAKFSWDDSAQKLMELYLSLS